MPKNFTPCGIDNEIPKKLWKNWKSFHEPLDIWRKARHKEIRIALSSAPEPSLRSHPIIAQPLLGETD